MNKTVSSINCLFNHLETSWQILLQQTYPLWISIRVEKNSNAKKILKKFEGNNSEIIQK